MKASRIANFVSAVFNLMNAILGAGIVGLPFALSNLGYIIFTLLLLTVAGLALFSINLLLKACDLHKTTSYEKLASLAFGRPGLWYTCTIITLHTMLSMISFMFIVYYEGPTFIRGIMGTESNCDSLDDEGKTEWYLRGEILAVMVVWIVVMPLAVAKNIDFLGKTSAVGMIAMIMFSIMIIVYKFIIECPVTAWEGAAGFFRNYNQTLKNCPEKLEEVFKDYEIEFYNQSSQQVCEAKAATGNSHSIYALPTMLFAFQCHASCLPVYAELQEGTRWQMMKVSVIAVSGVFTIYTTVSYFAYFTWYNLTLEEVLMMYSSLDASDPKILIARGSLLLCVIFSTPLLHFPCRKAQTKLFWPDTAEFSWIRHLGLMLINLGLVCVVVCFAPGIQTIFGYGGAITANSLEIILPCLFYYKLGQDSKKSALKIACLLIGITGIVLMIFITIMLALADAGIEI